MTEYPKINSIYKRNLDTDGSFIEGEFSQEEFEYLKDNQWSATEKFDGTNIRIIYDKELQEAGIDPSVTIKGKTDKAQIPKNLLAKLEELFPLNKFKDFEHSTTLYGEGIGEKIQAGGKYMPTGHGTDFVLFDVKVGHWWLKRNDVEGIANKLNIPVVPVIKECTLMEAYNIIKNEPILCSTFGKKDFPIEGFVLKPLVGLNTRAGNRIITKIKYVDFKRI
jgi:ATP-dependent RNA circularization protein (DNA/RNA ligase family)